MSPTIKGRVNKICNPPATLAILSFKARDIPNPAAENAPTITLVFTPNCDKAITITMIFVNKETQDPIKVKAPISETFFDNRMIPFFKIGPKIKPIATIHNVVSNLNNQFIIETSKKEPTELLCRLT